MSISLFPSRISTVRFALAAATLTLVATQAASPLSAAPADELRSAVAAGGSSSVSAARPRAFLAAYSSLLAGAKKEQVPDYAAAALRARPELLKPILDEAVSALSSRGRVPLGEHVGALTRAVVAARPESTRVIVRHLIARVPEARAQIRRGAIAAAPEQTDLIADASGGDRLQVANLEGNAAAELGRLRVNEVVEASGGAPAPATTTSAAGSTAGAAAAEPTSGSLNPANVSTTRLRRPIISSFR